MATINGLPYYEIHFNADGTLDTTVGAGDGGLRSAASGGGIADLFVPARDRQLGSEDRRASLIAVSRVRSL